MAVVQGSVPIYDHNNDATFTEGNFSRALIELLKLEMDITAEYAWPAWELVARVVSSYNTMIEELYMLRSKIPEVIDLLKVLRNIVDKGHKISNGVVSLSSAVSIAGGSLMIGGIVVAPFTAGTSIALSAVGCTILMGATAATVAAQATDLYKQRKKLKLCKDHQSPIEQHHKIAKIAYEDFKSGLNELMSIQLCPGVSSVEGPGALSKSLNLAGRDSKALVNKKMICGYVTRAVPVAAVVMSPFSREGIAVVRLFLPTMKAAGQVLTGAGLGVTGLGLVIDAILGAYSTYCVFSSSHKCEASKTISSYIKELEHFLQKVNLVISCSEQAKQLYLSEWRRRIQMQESERLKEKQADEAAELLKLQQQVQILQDQIAQLENKTG